MKKTIILFFLITLLITANSFAARKKVSEVVNIDGGKEVNISLELGAGEFTIIPS